MGGWQKRNADKFADSEDVEFDSAKLFERMQSLASAIRDVEPGGVYVVSARDREALFRAAAGALAIKEFELQRLSEYVDPLVLRFVAIEQRDAIARVFDVLWDLLKQADRGVSNYYGKELAYPIWSFPTAIPAGLSRAPVDRPRPTRLPRT